jgi:hypothetical protein
MLIRKLGEGYANDFWIWYTIVRKIDVDYVLQFGSLKEPITGTEKMSADVAQKIGEFAAVFAVVDRLNIKVRGDHAGLETFVDRLSPELRVAFLLQLRGPAKRDFQKHYPRAAAQIMGGIIKDSA